MQKKGDQPVWISLTMSAFLVFIHRFGDSSLITLCRTNVNGQRYVDAIERSVVLLGKGKVSRLSFLATAPKTRSFLTRGVLKFLSCCGNCKVPRREPFVCILFNHLCCNYLQYIKGM